MYIQICILYFFLSSFPTESENKSYSITSGTTISTTTQCPQVACTQPLCYAGYTLQYDPEGCHCPTVVPCPNLTCSHGTHPHLSGDNCECPQCGPCSSTCPPMRVTCPPDKLRNDTCDCTLCDDITWY